MDALRPALLFGAIIAAASGAAVNVILGDPVQFPTTGNCKKDGAKLQQRLTEDRTRQVAYFDSVWRPEAGYEDRISPNDSVVLNSTNMNDDGVFESTCGGEIIQVNVVEASEVSMTEGEDVKFPFHYVTAGKHGTYKLEKNGQLVFQLDVSSGKVEYGTGSQERLSVSPEWRSHGDLTVTLRGVNPDDRGDYYLSYIQDQDGRVKKRSAVRLKIRNPDQVPSSPPETCPTLRPTEDRMGTWSIVVLTAAVVLLIVAPLTFSCGWKMRSCRSNETFQRPRDVLRRLLPNRGTFKAGAAPGVKRDLGTRVQM